MTIFQDDAELLTSAHKLTAERLASLEKDVDHCLTEPYAPIPAIEYCFSTIDLFGALYKGNAAERAPTTQQSREYMTRFMGYTDEQVLLLQKIFRHKVVHLAIPKPIIKDNSRLIGWRYDHDNRTNHLKLTRFPQPQVLRITSKWQVQYEYQFSISIRDLVRDLKDSIHNTSNGYLSTLKGDSTLRANFEKAVAEIYDPAK